MVALPHVLGFLLAASGVCSRLQEEAAPHFQAQGPGDEEGGLVSSEITVKLNDVESSFCYFLRLFLALKYPGSISVEDALLQEITRTPASHYQEMDAQLHSTSRRSARQILLNNDEEVDGLVMAGQFYWRVMRYFLLREAAFAEGRDQRLLTLVKQTCDQVYVSSKFVGMTSLNRSGPHDPNWQTPAEDNAMCAALPTQLVEVRDLPPQWVAVQATHNRRYRRFHKYGPQALGKLELSEEEKPVRDYLLDLIALKYPGAASTQGDGYTWKDEGAAQLEASGRAMAALKASGAKVDKLTTPARVYWALLRFLLVDQRRFHQGRDVRWVSLLEQTCDEAYALHQVARAVTLRQSNADEAILEMPVNEKDECHREASKLLKDHRVPKYFESPKAKSKKGTFLGLFTKTN